MKLSKFIAYLQELEKIGPAEVLVQQPGTYGRPDPSQHPVGHIRHHHKTGSISQISTLTTGGPGLDTVTVTDPERFKVIIVPLEVVP